METKHTPGPWKVASTQAKEVHNVKIGVVARPSGRTFQEMEANARLIAAAPEMLEALKACLPLLTYWYEQRQDHLGPVEKSCVGQVRDAIAKAEGKE